MRYVIGRKGVAYYKFRHVPVADMWTGFSEQPNFVDAIRAATETLVAALEATSGGRVMTNGETFAGIDELYVVFTEFKNMVSQTPKAARVSPVGSQLNARPDVAEESANGRDGPTPDYEFEPEAEQLIAALLPRYISARIFGALLESAASESAARRRAMQSASDNASELIKTYTRLANQARQAEITQEISEIVGGADALASAGTDE